MKTAILVAVSAALLSACVPATLIPLAQGVGALAVDQYCREDNADFRAKTRERVWGDKDFTVVTRDDC